MMITLEMGPGFRSTVAQLDKDAEVSIDAISKGLAEGAKVAAGSIIVNYLRGQSLKQRTRALARSVDGWLANPTEAIVGVRENSAVEKYKWLLGDEDMTITPKKAKFLTIPIGENLTAAGATRYDSPRQVPDGFFIRSKNDQLLFGRKNGKRGKFRPLFVLVKSVFVQGSGALIDGVWDNQDTIAEEIEKSINKNMK